MRLFHGFVHFTTYSFRHEQRPPFLGQRVNLIRIIYYYYFRVILILVEEVRVYNKPKECTPGEHLLLVQSYLITNRVRECVSEKTLTSV